MKNTNCCPKCQSTKIIRIPGHLGSYGSGNNIPITTAAFMIKAVKVTRYLCTNCGFTEEWIDHQEDIEKLIKKYT